MADKKRIDIESAKEGMIVVEPISSGGMVLMDAGVVLTESSIKRLVKRKVSMITVQIPQETPDAVAENNIPPSDSVNTENLIKQHIGVLRKTSHSIKDTEKLKAAGSAIDFLSDHVSNREVLDVLLTSIKIPDDATKIKIISALANAQDKSKVLLDMIIAVRLYSQPVKDAALGIIEKFGDSSILQYLIPAMTSVSHSVNTRIMDFIRTLPADPVIEQAEKLLTSSNRVENTVGIQLLSLFKSQSEIDQLKREKLGLKKKDKLFEKKIVVEQAESTFAAEAAPAPVLADEDAVKSFEPNEDNLVSADELPLDMSKYEYSPVPKNERFIKYTDHYKFSATSTADMLKNIREGKSIDSNAIFKIAAKLVAQIKEDTLAAFKMTASTTRENYLLAHSINVAYISTIIGHLAGLKDNELLELSVSAIMHDAGMTKVRDLVWNKPKKINSLEYFDIQKHTIFGIDSLASAHSKMSKTIAYVAYQHHERVDGSGYPKGRTMHLISDYARIVGIADVYEALTSPRPYRPSYEPLAAMKIIDSEYRGAFDPKFLDFLRTFLQNNIDGDIETAATNSSAQDAAAQATGQGASGQSIVGSAKPSTTILHGINSKSGSIQNSSSMPSHSKLSSIQNNSSMPSHKSSVQRTTTPSGQSYSQKKIIYSSKDANSVKGHILMIDDEQGIIQMTQKIVEAMLPLSMDGCTDGHSGLNQLSRKNYDLVLLDIMMPEIDGITVLRAMRRSPRMKNLPVLFITAKRDRLAVEWALKLSVTDFVIKPYDNDLLVEKVRKTLAKMGKL